jgi:hypothetical protein
LEHRREEDEALWNKHGRSPNPGWLIEMLQDSLQLEGFTSWGWKVYRTCYDNEDDWEIFKSEFKRFLWSDMRRHFDEVEAKEHMKYLNFPFWEDSTAFRNASTAQLRQHFHTYLASEQALKGCNIPRTTLERRTGWTFASLTAYEFFLVADAASIASVIKARNTTDEYLPERMAWVNVVKVDWPPPQSELDKECKDDGYEPLVEGLSDYDVGVHRHSIQTLYPRHWHATYNEFDMWYMRPPEIGTEH